MCSRVCVCVCAWLRSEVPVDLAYPRGATLNVQEPAIPLVSSGYISYPLNRPIAAAYAGKV